MGSRATHDLRLRLSSIPSEDGSTLHHEYMIIGQEVETDFGKGHVRTSLRINATLLSPAIYAQIKPLLAGSAFVEIERYKLDRRKPVHPATPPPAEPPELASDWVDPDQP